ncbi:YciI family protein [Streptomyces sp. NPDC058086]|uniref:YciI family protein n=1 Tax=Streptomyces sp. NPDC058086 TaxID=3346334 RepID=UPI0036E55EFD
MPTEPVPEILFVCSAKVRADVAAALHARFGLGSELPEDIRPVYESHLSYSDGLGDAFYEAGPSADFTEILYIYRTESLEEAKKLMRADPLYAAGAFHDDSYFEWHIHPPLYKSRLPFMPEQVQEVEVEVTTPRTLIASYGTFDLEPMKDWQQGKAPRPLFQLLHLYNLYGEGGTATMGITWACGPNADLDKALHILAVPSIEMAKFHNEMDALYRWGIVSDFRYFEWCIHYPRRKATPRHRAVLGDLIEGAQTGQR